MALGRDSSAGRRFLALMAAGGRLKTSARAAGVGKETAYRWLREQFHQFRAEGLSVEEAVERLGYRDSRIEVWECHQPLPGPRRHHLRVQPEIEQRFWDRFDAGADLAGAAAEVGMSRSSGYRWLEARFRAWRAEGVSAAKAGRRLRLSASATAGLEQRRRAAIAKAASMRAAEDRAAVRTAVLTAVQQAEPTSRRVREQWELRYWQLMRAGVNNSEACRQLGISRPVGSRIRRAAQYRVPSAATLAAAAARSSPVSSPGPGRTQPLQRYLQLHERLLLADLLLSGLSIRAIAAQLGRPPSTVKRELDRHRDRVSGRYAPRLADQRAAEQRRRPKTGKLAGDARLQRSVQAKLDRLWSPEQICGWLRRHGDQSDKTLCHETIYRALLFPGVTGLDKRLTRKLRQGRALRRSRHLTRTGAGPTVTNKTMISDRPAVVDLNTEAGHWEGDLILGTGCASAMVTLRERRTQYGIVINLPHDHTAESTNAAIIAALAPLPPHLKRTLTWDQGVEMASHLQLARATGIKIYFAERAKPWQRPANENFNGLLRQYFPKGTDLSIHSPDHVAWVSNELNTRPRKTLDYRAPATLFKIESRRQPRQPVVSQPVE